mmetsp:Transcript_376/g.1223  ORF Transcript_376/g.1223 Transcript_376/m.1223 type:complete len:202 (-) Transcript_376:1040-1645(-)
MRSWSTTEGLARPPVAARILPTKKPFVFMLPPRNFSTCSGLSLNTWSTTSPSAAGSLIWPRPFSSTSAATLPPPSMRSGRSCFPALLEMVPSAMRAQSSARRAGVSAVEESARLSALRRPAMSPMSQFAASFESAPSASVASKKAAVSTSSASTRTSAYGRPSSMNRSRVCTGSSGIPVRTSSKRSAPHTTGGRSGSGKYR